jgi:hypothetical protein
VYVATDDGDVHIVAHGKEKNLLATVEMGAPVLAAPVYANGTLYVMTEGTLYAIQAPK